MNPRESIASPRPTVAVIDGDAEVRRSMHELIEAAGWQASTFATAQEFLTQPGSPDCVLLDVKLPDSCGLDLQARLANRPGTQVIFITHHRDIPLTVRAMKAGAADFLMKPVCHATVSTAIAQAIVLSSRNSVLRSRYASLSSREREVLELVVRGLLNKQVSGQLGISEVTVKVHRGRIMRKMAATSLAHLVCMAGDLGLQSARVLS
jgi:FixJ family two-component response regulator